MPNVARAHSSARSGEIGKDHLARHRRNEGSGGSSGIVLNLDMVWTSYFAIAYTLPVQVGTAQQNFSLQVDTGSSDLWVASKSCSSSSCSSTGGRLYDPSSSTPTGQTFDIEYVQGSVDGPIVWDTVQIGGYIISNQALAAATSVNNEPLSYDFDGILGLALPLNSVIQQKIPAQTGNIPDGAPISSNLFSISPSTDAPSQPFFSLSLARPGSSQVPSLLGIGRHPSSIVSDPTKIRYSQIVSDSVGELYWKTSIRAITVYVNGQAKPVTLQSLSHALYPTAVLDSGMPVIMTTSEIANGIYGALGISPASDGQYYVPCTTPINMTVTLDGQPELPIHPLDLTAEPSNQSGAQYCIGLIQSADSQLQSNSAIGDMVLGVPFMRNVYTVMAYENPSADGTFNTSVLSGIQPTLGLLGLTNATQAMEEFYTVRVLNQPLNPSSTPTPSAADGGNSLSVGVEVLIGLVGFFALCVAAFGLRCFFARRKWRKHANAASVSSSQPDSDGEQKVGYAAYELTRRNSRSSSVEETPGLTDTLRTFAFEPHKERGVSQYTVDSGRTYVDDPGVGVGEFGVKEQDKLAAMSPRSWRDTLGPDVISTPTSPEFPVYQHISRELASVPLLAHHNHHRRSNSDSSDLAEFGSPFMSLGMAGIGTAARGSQIDPDLGSLHTRMRSDSSGLSALSTMPLRSAATAARSSYLNSSTSSRRSVAGPRDPRPRSTASRVLREGNTLHEAQRPAEQEQRDEIPS